MKAGKLVAAIIGGYLLGRTKKLKFAIMVGGALAGKKITTDPTELFKLATKVVGQSPELQRLNEAVQGRLLEAGKDATLAIASSRMEALTDNLVHRVETIGKPATDAADAAGAAEGHTAGAADDAAGQATDAVGEAAGATGSAVAGAATGGRGTKRKAAGSEEPELVEDDADEALRDEADDRAPAAEDADADTDDRVEDEDDTEGEPAASDEASDEDEEAPASSSSSRTRQGSGFGSGPSRARNGAASSRRATTSNGSGSRTRSTAGSGSRSGGQADG